MDDDQDLDHESIIVQREFADTLSRDEAFMDKAAAEMCYYAGAQLMERLINEGRSAVLSAKISVKYRAGVAKMRLKAELSWVE